MSDGPLRAMGWFLLGVTGVALIMLALSIMALGWVITSASAHSWYDRSCCDLTDCAPLAPDQVRVRPDGYHLPNGQVVPFARARMSMDRDFHWCRRSASSPLIEPYGELACFYAPMGGM